jgi:hypothetical protein
MSSTYRILCLSHDPAIATEDEFSTAGDAERAVADGVDGHPGCDLLIGRYSYPLVEVGCPPTTIERPGRHRCSIHASTVWADVAWLRVLAAVYQAGDERLQALAVESSLTHPTLRHWPWERLRRLRGELGIDGGDGGRG